GRAFSAVLWAAERLVAEELVGAAAQADAGDAEDDRQDVEDGVPVEHGARPAGRVGGVLAGPAEDERADEDEHEAEREADLSAAAAAVERLHLFGGEVALFNGDHRVGHGARFSCGGAEVI